MLFVVDCREGTLSLEPTGLFEGTASLLGPLMLDGVDRFPCNADKEPALEGSWKTYAGRHDYSRWTLVGVPTGAANGFDVLDVDPKNGGDEWYRQNFDALPQTQAHESQSGGVHLLFRHVEGVRNRGNLFKGVDVRGEGGFVVWWPREGLPWDAERISEWPNWLLAHARRPIRRKVDHSGGRRRAVPLNSSPEVDAGIEVDPTFVPTKNYYARVQSLIRTVETAPRGERTMVLFWASCTWAEVIFERWGHSPVWRKQRRAAIQRAGESLLEAAETVGLVHDYDLGKVTSTIANGFRHVATKTRGTR